MKLFYLLLSALVLLSACNNSDVPADLSNKQFDGDTLHTPYRYAALVPSENGYGLQGKFASGLKVGILTFENGEVFTCTTTRSETIEDEFLGEFVITYLDKKPAYDSLIWNSVAVIDYKGQPFKVLAVDTIRDETVINDFKVAVNKDGSLKATMFEKNKLQPSKDESDRRYANVSKRTPFVISLPIPGIKANLISYQITDWEKTGADATSPGLISINGKSFVVNTPCGNIEHAYKLGNNYFLHSMAGECESDNQWREIHEIRPSGLKQEATF